MTDARTRRRSTPVPDSAEGPSLTWRFVASSWLILLIPPGAELAWLGFAIIAGIARRPLWWISVVFYAVAAIFVNSLDGTEEQVAQGTLTLVALIHGLIVNQSWLLLLWGRHENGLTMLGNPVKAQPPTDAHSTSSRRSEVPKELDRVLGARGTSRSDYVDESVAAPPRKRQTWAERRAAKAAARARKDAGAEPVRPTEPVRPAEARGSRPSSAGEPAEVELVDVNTANQRALAKLSGMDRGRAKGAIAERSRRKGFASLEDFAATAGLQQPHELARLRGEAFCSPRPRAPRTFGRRVDY